MEAPREKSKKKIEVKEGDLINVQITKGYKGDFPVGKFGSIFCKLYIPKSAGRIEYDSTCLCKVTEVKEKMLCVTVREVVKSAAANRFELEEKLKSVKVEDQSKKKNKKNYTIGLALEKAVNKISIVKT